MAISKDTQTGGQALTKDQLQHIEITRDVASRFHAKVGETFVLPEAKIDENTKLIPGTDGAKMSKSKNNIINIFLPDKNLRKQVMSIATDSTPLEDPKNPDTCNVFAIYKLLATKEQVLEMRANYEKGGYGYGHAKQALYELILDVFKSQREKYNYYIENTTEVEKALQVGAKKATAIANEVLKRVRGKVGY